MLPAGEVPRVARRYIQPVGTLNDPGLIAFAVYLNKGPTCLQTVRYGGDAVGVSAGVRGDPDLYRIPVCHHGFIIMIIARCMDCNA